jgi:transposase
MLGRQERWQEDLFVAAPLSSLIPDDHILKRVDAVLNFSWLREEVQDLYCSDNGRPGIDPEAAVRLMLAGFFYGIVHDRKLMREAQVNLAIRWFAGFRLDERLPDHSSLTRIRQRWGSEKFYRIFQYTVQACVTANLVNVDTVHVDATLIRANVSWDSIPKKHAEKVMRENNGYNGVQANDMSETKGSKKVKRKSTTDPEAALSTSSRNRKLEPSYKQHTSVEDQSGVIVDVLVTPGNRNEGEVLQDQIQRIEDNTGRKVKATTADAGYAYGKVYGMLEARQIDAVIPAKKARSAANVIPIERFKYDGKHKTVRCPRGRILKRSSRTKHGWYYRSSVHDCRDCPLRRRCLSAKVDRRTIVISEHYEALLRARRRRPHWDEVTQNRYRRHRWRAEGAHSEAKLQHGLSRAVRWGLSNMRIQCCLTAAVMNLKRLAALIGHLWKLLIIIFAGERSYDTSGRFESSLARKRPAICKVG